MSVPRSARHTRPAATRRHRFAPTTLALAAALALLAACGGGDDDEGDDTPPAPTALTLTGTAATGAALGTAPVEAKCSGGGTTGTTLADGRFTLTLPADAALPCVLKATGPAGAYYSVAPGTGIAATTVNVTPVTSLAVAVLAAGEAAGYFDGFNGTAAAALTPAAAQQAVAAVKTTLAAAGIDLDGIDVLAGPLVPAAAGAAGNAHDQALDLLATKLAAGGTTLAQLASVVVAAAPNAPATAATAAPALPADLLLKPPAATCKALRSGRYRALDLADYQEGDGYPTFLIDIDASTLIVKDVGIDETSTMVPVPGTPCRFTVGDGIGPDPDAEVVVSSAGVITVRFLDENVGGTWRASVLLPEQTQSKLADLAGDWNGFGYWRPNDTEAYRMVSTTVTVDAQGKWSNQVLCSALGCADVQSTASFVADGSGGFFLDGTTGTRYRAWPYRAGNGALMLAVQDSRGGTSFYTRKQARTLPAAGLLSEGWQFTIVPSGNASAWFTAPQAVNPFRSTVLSVDAAQKEYVRQNTVNFATGVTQQETVRLDEPLPGFLYRVPATGVVRSDGSTGNVGAWINLPLRGMGLNVLGIVGSNQMVLSTNAAQ